MDMIGLTITVECNLESDLGTKKMVCGGCGNFTPLLTQFSAALKMRILTFGWPMSYEDHTCSRGVLSSKQKSRQNREIAFKQTQPAIILNSHNH